MGVFSRQEILDKRINEEWEKSIKIHKLVSVQIGNVTVKNTQS